MKNKLNIKNGLLGLDFLRQAKIILDLEELVMYTK